MKARFVKGHMGGNTIALFRWDDFPWGKEIGFVIEALQEENLACHQGGLLLPGPSIDRLKVAIAGRSSRSWISFCGGFTQVLGKALADESCCKFLDFALLSFPAFVVLETEAGSVSIEIARQDTEVSVWTDMTAFVKELYHDGFEEMVLQGFPVHRIGKFLTVNAKVLKTSHPYEEIESLSMRVRKTLIDIQEAFFQHIGRKSFNFVVYDDLPKHGGEFRVVFPHNLSENHIEPACGTGTVAASIALFLSGALKGRLSYGNPTCEVIFESGGGPFLGGPEYTMLHLEGDERKISNARFSHSCVEITASGNVFMTGRKFKG